MSRSPPVVALLALLQAASARAAEPPRVDPRDLPPLPELAATDTASAIAVVAATQASEETVTGAAKREQSLGNVASAVTVIPGDRLRRFGYRTMADALRAVAGLYVVDDRYSERLGIRGLGLPGDFNTRILVLIDGATISEPWNQFTGIGWDLPVHLDDVVRIEIVRGPVGSIYGTNAFFGIINIVTRGAEAGPRLYGRFSAGSYGSVGGNAGFALGGLDKQVRASFSYWNRDGDTITIPEFVDAGAPSASTQADHLEAWHAALVARYQGAFAQVRAYRRERQLTAAPYDTVAGDPRNMTSDQQIATEAGYTRELGDRATLTVRGYWSRYQYNDYLVYSPPPNFLDIGDSDWYGGEVRAHVRLLDQDRLGLTVGGEVTIDDVRSQSFYEGMREMGVSIPTRFNVEGLYAEVESALTQFLSVVGGVRLDINSIFENNLSPRGAVLLHQGDRYGVKLLYAEGFRNPSPLEAFFADSISFVANPLVRPEKIRSFEGVLWSRPRRGVNLRLSGFRWDMSDLLEQVSVDTPDGPRLQFQNSFSLSSTGAELEGFYRDTRGFLGFASATFAVVERCAREDPSQPSSPTVCSGADHSFNAPQLSTSAGLSSPALWKRVHLSTELYFLSRRPTRDPTGMVSADPFLGWNLALYLPELAGFDLTIAVRNLIGTREQLPVSQDFDRMAGMVPVYRLPGDGREIYARIGYSY